MGDWHNSQALCTVTILVTHQATARGTSDLDSGQDQREEKDLHDDQ